MDLDPRQILVHAFGFLILFGILRKFVWGHLLGAMEARSKRISDQFAAIEEGKKELEELKLQYQEHLNKIEEEARVKIQAAIGDGRRIAMEIEEDARVRIYRLRRKPFKDLNAWLSEVEATWTQQLSAFKAHAEKPRPKATSAGKRANR